MATANGRKTLLKTRLVLTFYRSFVVASIVITVCCAVLVWKYGIGVFVGAFWLKVLSLGVIYYLVNDNKRAEYYYYFNLGLSQLFLWGSAVFIDFVFFATALIITNLLR